MSETTIPGYQAGDIAIQLEDDGWVSLSQRAPDADISDIVSDIVLIPPDQIAAVALALLGGITDDLVERCARADYVATWGDDHWDEAKERVRIDHREHARAVLAAIGGTKEGDDK